MVPGTYKTAITYGLNQGFWYIKNRFSFICPENFSEDPIWVQPESFVVTPFLYYPCPRLNFSWDYYITDILTFFKSVALYLNI